MEAFKDISGYEGIYQVSDCGDVKSLRKIVIMPNGGKRITGEKLLKPYSVGKEYLSVKLCKDGREKNFKVHRLVAMAFIPNHESKKEVNHKNKIRTDNRVTNLEWVTRKENVIHSYL